jgi:hypothetical protein
MMDPVTSAFWTVHAWFHLQMAFDSPRTHTTIEGVNLSLTFGLRRTRRKNSSNVGPLTQSVRFQPDLTLTQMLV